MKNTLAFLLVFLYAAGLNGQTPDTTFISISQENASLEKQQLMDSYDQVFGTLEPTRWLFALNFSALSGNQDDLLRASAEVKLTPAISLHGAYGFGYESIAASPYRSETTTVSHRFAVEPRWYYAMPRRIRQGRGANNMSGNYIGLEGVFVRTNSNIGQLPVVGEQRSFALRYGVQRRLFRYGFLDIGFGLGILKEERSAWRTPFKDEWHIFANSQIGIGLALARPRTTAASGGYCDVLRCFREERQMWKIDLYNLIRINSLDDLKGQLSIAYERKLGTSPFSLQAQGEWSQAHSYTNYLFASPYLTNNNTATYSGTLQSRYYYSQQQRIAKGKSGNNLSGVYVGGQLRWLAERDDELRVVSCDADGVCTRSGGLTTTQNIGGGLLWGIQHRFFQHGFIDFQVLGSQAWVKTKYLPQPTDPPRINSYLEFTTTFRLRAGLAF